MFFLKINEDHYIWLALTGSLLVHGLIFICSGRTFIPHAQYSVQPSFQTVEISIEERQPSKAVVENGATSIKAPAKANKAKEISHPKSVAAVKVEAKADYFQNQAPEYPPLAKQMRQEGLVLLSVDVDMQGAPVKVEVRQSSGHRLLDEAALNAVSHWKFLPARIGAVPMESTATVPIRFRLEK